jgi:Sec-independent protein translocase protein TatA
MIVDISAACASAAFIVLVIFLIIGIVRFNRTAKEINRLLHATKKDMDELSVEGIKLIKNLNETTGDAKKKLHALDVFFKPLYVKQDTEIKSKKNREYDLASEIIEGLSAGMILYNKVKEGIREYGKSR